MSVTGALEAAAQMKEEAKKVVYLATCDYESRELWKSVALILTNDSKYDVETVIGFSDQVAKAYINFVNSQENN